MGSWQCGAESGKLRWLKAPKNSSLAPRIRPLIVDDGWSFQHFIDGVLPKLFNSLIIQSLNKHEDTVTDSTVTILPSTLQEGVKKMIEGQLSHLSFREISEISDVNPKTQFFCSQSLQFSCKAPQFHPIIYKKMQGTLSLEGKLKRENTQKPQKDVILFLDRKQETSKNGLREVLNHEELMEAMGDLVKGTDWSVQVFDHSKHDSMEDLVIFMRDVKVIMGVHGGAFYNMFFADRKEMKAVIEFMPVNWEDKSVSVEGSPNIFWISSSLLDIPYYRLLSNGTFPKSVDVTIDIPAFTNLLSNILSL